MLFSDDERRASIRLLQYWNVARDGRAWPAEEDIDPDAIPGLWDCCFMVQTRDIEQVTDYNYTYFGSQLIEEYESGKLKKHNGMMACPDARELHPKYLAVLGAGEPMIEEDHYVNEAGDTVFFRQSMMPLGTPEKVLALIGAVTWKIVSGEATKAA